MGNQDSDTREPMVEARIHALIAGLGKETGASARIAIGQMLASIGRPAWEPLLAAAARSNDLDFGWSVAWALPRFQDAVDMEDCLAALRHPNVHVRWASALMLGRYSDARVVKALVYALGEDGPPTRRGPTEHYPENYHHKVRTCAAQSLRQIGPPAYPALTGALRDPNQLVRAGAANALTGATDARLLAPLRAAASDPNPDARRYAVLAIAGLAASLTATRDRAEARDTLVEALFSRDISTQHYAAEGLAALGPEAADTLVAIIADATADRRNENARAYAMIGLKLLLTTVSMPSAPPSPLADRLYPTLMRALLDPANPGLLRQEAAQAIAICHDPRAVDPLINLLSDPDRWLRIEIAQALRALGDKAAIPALEQALQADRAEMASGLEDHDEDWPYALEDAIKALRAL